MLAFMKQSQIKVSIILPIYNVEAYLMPCLESLKRAITAIPAEVLLIDDGSADRSSDIAKAFAEDNEAFKYYRKENGGLSSARNYGLRIAQGKYIAFADSDDIVEENIYSEMLFVAEKHHCDMVICDAMRLDKNKLSYSSLHRRAYYNIRNLNIDINRTPELIFDSTAWNRLTLRSLFTKNNIWFPEGYRYEDFPVTIQLHYYAKNVRFIRNWGYQWRIRSDSITRSHEETKNLTDKIHTLELARRFAMDHNASAQFLRNFDYRVLFLEFNGTIGSLKEIDREQALQHLSIAADYIEQSVDLSVLQELPIYDRQKIEYILKRDLDGLLRLMNYKRINYENAPIIEKDGVYAFVLPDKIFTVADRDARYEYAHLPYYQGIDSIDLNGNSLRIHAHIYLRRIELPDIDSQKVNAFLVNALEDGELALVTKNELRPSLTQFKGTVCNTDDYDEYHYNYDGSGFYFDLDLESLTRDLRFRGRNYILLENENPVCRNVPKVQLLRYASKQARAKLTNCSFRLNGCEVTVSLNAVDTLELKILEVPDE